MACPQPKYEPTPATIAKRAAAIRAEWSDETERIRAGRRQYRNPIPGADTNTVTVSPGMLLMGAHD